MKFVKIVHKISKWIAYLPYVAICAMMLLVVGNCILRRFGLPILATYDLACFLLILIIAPAIANCECEKGHIYLEILVDKLPYKVQQVIGLVINILCFAFCAMCTYGLYVRSLRFIKSGQTALSIAIPVWPFVLLEAISIFFCSLVFLANIVTNCYRLKNNDAADGGKEQEI